MQTIAYCCILMAASQLPDTEYKGLAYADRSDKRLAAVAWSKREALILCIRVGLGPDKVKRLFGGPSLVSRFRDGPIEWWYPELGATVYWPARLFKPVAQVERVHGSVR